MQAIETQELCESKESINFICKRKSLFPYLGIVQFHNKFLQQVVDLCKSRCIRSFSDIEMRLRGTAFWYQTTFWNLCGVQRGGLAKVFFSFLSRKHPIHLPAIPMFGHKFLSNLQHVDTYWSACTITDLHFMCKRSKLDCTLGKVRVQKPEVWSGKGRVSF